MENVAYHNVRAKQYMSDFEGGFNIPLGFGLRFLVKVLYVKTTIFIHFRCNALLNYTNWALIIQAS